MQHFIPSLLSPLWITHTHSTRYIWSSTLRYLIITDLEILPASRFSPVSVFQGEVLTSLPFFKQFPQSVPNSPSLTITAAIPKNLTGSRQSFMKRGFHTVTVNSLDVLHVILGCREALVDSSFVNGDKAIPHWFSCVRKTVVQSYSRSLSLTVECKGELWLNNSSQTSTYTLTHTFRTHNAVGKLLKLPPTRARPCAF